MILDIKDVLQYLPAAVGICLGAAVLAALVLCLIPSKRRSQIGFRAFAAVTMCGYGVMLLGITFLSREPGSRGGFDWMPLSTLGHGSRGDAFVLENILLFIPLGILLPSVFLRARNIWFCTVCGFLLSIAIESGQYVTGRGYAQTDDVLTNTAGMFIGAVGFSLIHWIIRIIKGKGSEDLPDNKEYACGKVQAEE